MLAIQSSADWPPLVCETLHIFVASIRPPKWRVDSSELLATRPCIAEQDDGSEGPPGQGTLPRWDFSTGPGLRSHQLATLRNMPSGDLPDSALPDLAADQVRSLIPHRGVQGVKTSPGPSTRPDFQLLLSRSSSVL